MLRQWLGLQRKSAGRLVALSVAPRASWSPRDYAGLAREGYGQNAVANRCVRLIAEAAAAVPLRITGKGHAAQTVEALLARPNPDQTGVELLEVFHGHLQVAGNAYLEIADGYDGPSALFVLRPDRMNVVPGPKGWADAWEYRLGADRRRLERDRASGRSPVLHLKLFHPDDDHYGLPPMAAAARDVLARLGALYGFDMVDRADGVAALPRSGIPARTLDTQLCVRNGSDHPVTLTRPAIAGQVREVRIAHIGDDQAYAPAMASARGLDAAVEGIAELGVRILAAPDQARNWAQELLAAERADGVILDAILPPSLMALEAGDAVHLEGAGLPATPMVLSSLDGMSVRQAGLSLASARSAVLAGAVPAARQPEQVTASRPMLVVMDLPVLAGDPASFSGLKIAAFASPWPGPLTLHAGPEPAALRPVAEIAKAAVTGRLDAPLGPGFEGRWDRASVLDITLLDGGLESVDPALALAGANQLAVEGADGWEVIQFASAELVGPSQWRVSGLIRAIGGSAAAGAAAGSRVVLLDDAVVALDVDDNAIGAPLHFAAVPPGRTLDDISVRRIETVYRATALRPLSPVHVQAHWQEDGLAVSWIRRTRHDGDAWSMGEVALGEAEERYRIELVDASGGLQWHLETSSPQAVIPAAFAVPAPVGAQVRVAQISQRTGPGAWAEIALPAPVS
ncbi:MAG: phage portal protein [Caulobacterales bacterium]|uniref:phage portal protein n=1 Tax=Glycocaulis sp. TaxID=1969725 RepID=UPI003FA126F0